MSMGLPCEVKPHPITGLYNGKFAIWLFLASEVMLFGALFSSYVLLRVGADYWPHGYTVLNVPLATLNTMVLITSSVTMVLAWAQLKLNNVAKARMYMWATVALAFGFLIIKGFEYGPKFNHYQIWFKDSSRATIEGHDLTDHGDYLTIVTSKATFGSKEHPVRTGSKESQLDTGDHGSNGSHGSNGQGSNGQDTHAGGEVAAHTGGHAVTRVEKADVLRWAPFTPRHSNFLGTYWTMTSLHGLHVIGGIIVIGYLAGPGLGLWKKNKEHFTNRVECAGLYWHFVDLVWIFLFPSLYLL